MQFYKNSGPIWLLLSFCSFYSFILGTFIGLGASQFYWSVPISLVLAVAYCVMFCLWQRRANWVSIAITVALIGILTQFNTIVDFLAAYLPSFLYIIFGEVGIRLLNSRSRKQTFYILVSSSAGALLIGELIGVMLS